MRTVSELITSEYSAILSDRNVIVWADVIKNVNAYGLVGDGETNNSPALNDMINLVEPGSIIWFPDGDYVVSSPIIVNKRITITGSGRIHSNLGNGNVAQTYEYQPYVFKVQSDFVTFQGLRIENPNNHNCNGGIYVTANNCIVDGCQIDNFTMPIIAKNGYQNFTATGNIITNVYGMGTENFGDGIMSMQRYTTISNNHVKNKGGTDSRCGIVLDIDARYSTMTANTVQGAFRRSYHIEISPYSTMVGNTGVGATQYGVIIVNDIVTCEGNVFQMDGVASYTGNPPLGICVPQWFRNISIINNIVAGSGGTNDVGIQINGYNNIIAKNQVIGPAGNFSTGIYVQGNNASIEDNIVDDSAVRGRGIWVYECDGSRIRGNRVTKSGSHGINLSNSKYCLVADNHVINSNGVGIILENSHHSVIADNHAYDNQVTKTQTTGIANYGSNNTVLQGNFCMDNKDSGMIPANGATGCFVSGNKGFDPGEQTAPAVPASGTAITNPFPYDCRVYISGAITGININGTGVGAHASLLLRHGESITVNYSTAPTWKWFAI